MIEQYFEVEKFLEIRNYWYFRTFNTFRIKSDFLELGCGVGCMVASPKAYLGPSDCISCSETFAELDLENILEIRGNYISK